MVQGAGIREFILHDIAHFGIRASVGIIFIFHGTSKINPGFGGFLNSVGVPLEMQLPLAIAETLGGSLLIIGILSRISSSVLSMIMLSVIFYIKKAHSLSGQMGVELELLLLATNLSIIVIGPGRISVSHMVKQIPRFLQ
ncbi:MAG: DoxX family protein [Nitrososphaera sp.]|jgi:putative oxidoreductase